MRTLHLFELSLMLGIPCSCVFQSTYEYFQLLMRKILFLCTLLLSLLAKYFLKSYEHLKGMYNTRNVLLGIKARAFWRSKNVLYVGPQHCTYARNVSCILQGNVFALRYYVCCSLRETPRMSFSVTAAQVKADWFLSCLSLPFALYLIFSVVMWKQG